MGVVEVLGVLLLGMAWLKVAYVGLGWEDQTRWEEGVRGFGLDINVCVRGWVGFVVGWDGSC